MNWAEATVLIVGLVSLSSMVSMYLWTNRTVYTISRSENTKTVSREGSRTNAP